jgi:isopentenyl-diphosphate Delta-isomerase
MREEVILVDSDDRPIGTMEKMEAHVKGLLHRAFSVFIFDAQGRMLLQKRAADKYHSPGLMTNACCSHPRPGEDTAAAASRRLREEMGLSAELSHVSTFTYRSEFANGLTEHEVDHIYKGVTSSDPVINPLEVSEYKWMQVADIKKDITENPDRYTTWFRMAMEKFF